MPGHQQSAGFEITKIAGETIPGGAAVIIDTSGRAYLFDPSNDNHYSKSVGIARHSAMEDHSIDICFAGEIVVAGSGWVAGTAYYVGAGGVLTSVIPAVGTPCMIGVGTAQDTILIKVSVPVKAGTVTSGSTSGLVINETPSGIVNGANATFTTALGFIPESVEVFINGCKLTPVADYITIGSNQIQMMVSPLSGEVILVNYLKQL